MQSPLSRSHHSQCVLISHHIIFYEDHFPYFGFHNAPQLSDYDSLVSEDPPPPPLASTHFLVVSSPTSPIILSSADNPTATQSSLTDLTSPPPTSTSNHYMTTRSCTGSLKPCHIFNLSATLHILVIRRSIVQALSGPRWKSAMDSEMSSLHSNHTWDFVPRPPHANIVGC